MRCGSILPIACRFWKWQRRSTRSSRPLIRATPYSAAPSGWGLPGSRSWNCQRAQRHASTGSAKVARLDPARPDFFGRYRQLKRQKLPSCAASRSGPRHLSVVDLERAECRYPYGGDEEGEAITFCGHPCHPGSSYCTPHFHLSRGPGTPSELAAHIVLLRVTAAASG